MDDTTSTGTSNAATARFTRESASNDFYGYLQHPSGLTLPKLLQRSLKQKKEEEFRRSRDQGYASNFIDDGDDDDTNYEETKAYCDKYGKERYWNVTEIIDMINATSETIQNVQTQIMNGEDYYVNNVTSISIYNTGKNNYSDSTSFLDSKSSNDFTNNNSNNNNSNNNGSNTGGGNNNNMSSNYNNSSYAGINSNSNQHRWFSSSCTNITPYQQTVPYPVLPKKEQRRTTPSFTSSTVGVRSKAATISAQSQPSTEHILSATAATIAATANDDDDDAEVAATTTTTVMSNKRRSSTVQPPPPVPTRRSTKRRRKT